MGMWNVRYVFIFPFPSSSPLMGDMYDFKNGDLIY